MDPYEVIQFTKAEIQEFHEAYNLSCAQARSSGAVDMAQVYAAQFQFAHALVQSADRSDIKNGIRELKQLIQKHADETSRRDYTYYCGLGHYRLRDDQAVIGEMKKILRFEPQNHQALNLKKAAEKRLKRDGLIGMGVASAVGVVGVAVLGALVAKKH